ncbi:MAG: transposase family protein [Lachnospiraceae bacterium]|jgi:hypothetical protein|nr:transposase family protein [Lachnospiraceae bacterium]
MSRERERIIKKREKNAVVECNKIQQQFYPELFSKFAQVKDPRHNSYIDYSMKEMLGTLYYKGISGLSSMQEMTRKFNDETVAGNLYQFMGSEIKNYTPHGVTLNELLERIEPSELEKVEKDLVYKMIRRKTFDDAKVLKRWLVLVDATELDESYIQKNEYYLSRTYNRDEKKEFVKYHRSVLEAKIYFGNSLVCSIASETIENSDEYNEKKMSDEAIKQDCESKAFVRLASKLKKNFKRLPLCIVADGLYVSHKVIETCISNKWDYLIRYKEGCASSIKEEYDATPEKNRQGNMEYVNGVLFGRTTEVNFLKYTERKVKDGREIITEFAWITSIEITDKNAKKLVKAGRSRWKIENQGFNRQKHWQGNIEHACSFNEKAQKNHYIMEQIADFIKQLYEYFFLNKNEIKKLQKNISSDLLASFGRQLTREDISSNDMLCISQT